MKGRGHYGGEKMNDEKQALNELQKFAITHICGACIIKDCSHLATIGQKGEDIFYKAIKKGEQPDYSGICSYKTEPAPLNTPVEPLPQITNIPQ